MFEDWIQTQENVPSEQLVILRRAWVAGGLEGARQVVAAVSSVLDEIREGIVATPSELEELEAFEAE